MGIFGRYGILTALDVWTYATRGMSQTRLLALGPAVAVAAGAAVKGAYSQVVAALGVNVDGIMVRINRDPFGANSSNFLVDVAVGGAGAEVVVAEDIKANYIRDGAGQSFEEDFQIHVPNIKIAAGSRVAVRASSSAGAANITVEVCGSQ